MARERMTLKEAVEKLTQARALTQMTNEEAVARAKELLDLSVDPHRTRAMYDLRYELGLCMDVIEAYMDLQDVIEFG